MLGYYFFVIIKKTTKEKPFDRLLSEEIEELFVMSTSLISKNTQITFFHENKNDPYSVWLFILFSPTFFISVPLPLVQTSRKEVGLLHLS